MADDARDGVAPMAPYVPMPPMDVAGRLDRARALLSEHECDGLLVTKLENIAYLTGFTGSSAMLLVRLDGALLLTDGRYRDQSKSQLSDASVDAEIVVGGYIQQFSALAGATTTIGRLGLEAGDASWSLVTRLGNELTSVIVPTTNVIESLRVIKDEGEIARIERACEIADASLGAVKDRLTEGLTESEFAAELEFEMRRLGSTGASFETIVASGPNGALPHARPTNRTIVSGDLVVIDFGAMVDGYHSDMTRTFVIGAPTEDQSRQILAVTTAQQAGVEALRPGVSGGEIDRVCRDTLSDLGFGEFFTHGTGHGVGREIHEAPSVSSSATDSLRQGMVVTVEPGAYLPGIGGVRVEDTLVMIGDGARPLTKSTKDYLL